MGYVISCKLYIRCPGIEDTVISNIIFNRKLLTSETQILLAR